jgi:hypothetical protein
MSVSEFLIRLFDMPPTRACVQLPEPCATIGAMTHSFIKSLECETRPTYGRLLSSMRTIMRQGGPCSLQGPAGSSIRKVTNFSGVEVSDTFFTMANRMLRLVSVPCHDLINLFTYIFG